MPKASRKFQYDVFDKDQNFLASVRDYKTALMIARERLEEDYAVMIQVSFRKDKDA